jgi:hypothetical protein
MKVMALKFSMIFLCVGLVCVSCRKTTIATLPPDPVSITGKLSKVEYGSNMYDSMYYNNEGAISKLIFRIGNPATQDEAFTFDYDASGKLVRVNYKTDTYYDYHYLNGRVSTIEHYVSGVERDYNLYSYQGDKVSSVAQYLWTTTGTPGFELIGRQDFTYYADGNLKQEADYHYNRQTHLPVRNTTVDYVNYDNKPNVTDFLATFPYMVEQSKNNPGKIIFNNEIDNIIEEFYFAYTYDNLFKTATRTFSYLQNGQSYSETAKYYYY